MNLPLLDFLALCELIFLVALAYSSVGHGGASGYLAALTLFSLAASKMVPSALVLNLLVAGMAFVSFARAGHFSRRLLLPFVATSIPAAFLGGLIPVSVRTYSFLLAGALLFAAFRLIYSMGGAESEPSYKPPSVAVSLPVGAVLGFVSGMVGVGGGIFLSPLLLLLRWADAKRTAAVSAAFIFLNSAAGLYGHLSRTQMDWPGMLPLVAAAFSGGLVGSYLGAWRLPSVWLRRILGIVLLVAAFKLVRTALG